ncbi:MAG: hypothetical protein SFV21_21080 [Rhodospirillaceae bacterium]|nr:hypothetical protein [Rhodospirillaceae bacterium]
MSTLNDKIGALVVTVFVVIGLSAAMKPTLAAEPTAKPAVATIVAAAPAVAERAKTLARVIGWIRAIDAASPIHR